MRLVLVAVMLVVGVVSTAAAWRNDGRAAEARARAEADSITGTVRSTAENSVAGLSGAAGLVSEDGTVLPSAFEAFRREVASASSLDTIAYVPIVRGAERAAFEARTGVRIQDLDLDEAGLTVAGERDTYWPVTLISPADSIGAPLKGVDISVAPIASEAALTARDGGETVVTEAVSIEPVVRAVVFIVKPLYHPDLPQGTVEERRAAHVGFVASFYTGDDLAQDLGGDVPDEVTYSIADDDVMLAQSGPAGTGGIERSIEIGGRSWTVTVQDSRPADHQLAWFLGVLTLLIVGGLLYLIRRSTIFEQRLSRSADLIGRTAELAQHLAGAATVDEVGAVISNHVPAVFDAAAAGFGVAAESGEAVEVLRPGPEPGWEERSLSEPGPITDAVRASRLIMRREHEDWPAYVAGAGVAPDVAAGVRSIAGLALEAQDGTVVAGVGILWDRLIEFDRTTIATLFTVTELCEQTLQRARMTDQVAVRAAQLAHLAERLAGVTTFEETADVITTVGREPVGSTSASLGVIDHQEGVLRLHHGDTVDAAVSEAFPAPPLDADLVVTEAARTGRPVLVPDWDAYQARYPGTDSSHAALGRGARAALPLRDNEETIGAIVFAWPDAQVFDDAAVSTLSTIAEMAAQSVQRARLAESQMDDARHSRDLARLAQGLATRAHTEDVTGFLAETVVTPLDAVHAAVGLIEGDSLHRYFAAPLPEASELREDFGTTPLTESTPLTDAARTGQDVLLGSADDLEARYPGMSAVWDSVGFAATANLALRDRNGTVIGALGVAWDDPVVFDEELRDRLTTLVGIAGQTLERARLADMLLQSATRNELLADFAQSVARARTVEDLVAAVVEQAAPPVEAAIANLGLVDRAHNRLTVQPHPRYRTQGERFGSRSLDDHLPGPDTVRTQRPVILSSPEEIGRRYPGRYAEAVQATGVGASIHLPLTSPNGDALGTIGFAWTSPQQFSPTTIATVRTIAELCTQTLERTRLGEAEHRLVSSLQHRVVTPLPDAPGLTIAQRYRPAARHVGMGGDWYEGISLDDGRYALLMGDIAGHGITAVADMIQLRAILGALVRSGAPLGEVFARASSLVRGTASGVTASACIVLVDEDREGLTYVAAGHPPPIVRTADGTVIVLDRGRQPLLGIPIQPIEPARVPFGPDSMLIAYTDGLVERRGEDIDTSIRRLADALASVSTPNAESAADELIDRCLEGSDPQDDVALVVVTRDPRPVG